jgi:hypothetical protein
VTVANTTVVIGPCYSTFTAYVVGIASFSITSLTDNSGGSATNTIAAQTGSYVQATQQNTIASLAAKINTILTLLKAVGMAQ